MGIGRDVSVLCARYRRDMGYWAEGSGGNVYKHAGHEGVMRKICGRDEGHERHLGTTKFLQGDC